MVLVSRALHISAVRPFGSQSLVEHLCRWDRYRGRFGYRSGLPEEGDVVRTHVADQWKDHDRSGGGLREEVGQANPVDPQRYDQGQRRAITATAVSNWIVTTRPICCRIRDVLTYRLVMMRKGTAAAIRRSTVEPSSE